MSLAPGEKLGPYEIVAFIGAGGMGEVYRATDTRLHRAVAVKISTEHFSDRFEREARAVAALNHPNVCTLHDVGPNYLVMELVEGPTLAERIHEGPLSLDETLTIARQIANALEAAHERGIVHRDLKPANVKIKADGTVKVLDFGLAKMAEPTATPSSNPSYSPTLTLEAATRAGVIMGTAGYMAPEQATGKPVDKRADIFAFGVVVYEMLTGGRLFQGETVSETMASVLKDEPALERVPPPLRPLLKRCLEKDPRKRLRDIGDIELLLQQPAPPPLPAKRFWLPWAVAAMFAAAMGVVTFLRLRASAPPEIRTMRFLVDAPGNTQFANAYGATAISPDGRYLVFAAGKRGSAPLWLRALDSVSARPLQGSEGANIPFWSPDSKAVGFFAGGKLKRSDISGGAPQVLCAAPFTTSIGFSVTPVAASGGTWNRDGVIVFAGTDGLFRVPASGGVPQRLTQLDPARRELEHGLPQFLPERGRFLYFTASTDPNIQGIYASSLDNPKERIPILTTNFKVSYVPPLDGRHGFLLWMRGRILLAQPFDAARLRLEGDPSRVAEDLSLGSAVRAPFWTSDAGVLAYRSRDSVTAYKGKLIWMSRNGKRLGEAGKEDHYDFFQLSPDGASMAVGRSDDSDNGDIWRFEFKREVMTRLTSDPNRDANPVWSPDGRRIAFDSDRSGIRQFYLKSVGGGGEEEQLTTDSTAKALDDWSKDGRYLVYEVSDPKTRYDLWVLPLAGDRKPVALVQTPFNERSAKFSPDGKWIAYDSDASGRTEVYVRAFPALGDQWQVSSQGGLMPRWRADGKELFYVGADQDKIMAADVRIAGGSFQSDTPRELFRITPMTFFRGVPYDVTPDGQRFLVLEPSAGAEGPAPLTVVLNWQAGLRK